MEHVKLLISALKHFIRYNTNKVGQKMLLKNHNNRLKLCGGLCGYVYTYIYRKNKDCSLNRHCRAVFTPYIDEETCKGPYGSWLHSYKFDGIVTKKRLKVAQKILKKLEKGLKTGIIEGNEVDYAR